MEVSVMFEVCLFCVAAEVLGITLTEVMGVALAQIITTAGEQLVADYLK
jgi:hypothetical protein